MVGRFALFAFNGDPMCFRHVILNALDLREKGNEVKVIIEGSATTLVKDFNNESNFNYQLYQKLIESGLIDCCCKACSAKMGTLENAEKLGLNISGEMSGHPRMSKYIELGFTIITF